MSSLQIENVATGDFTKNLALNQPTHSNPPTIMYKQFQGGGVLPLNIGDNPMTRTLPVESMAENHYSNVTFYDINSREGWEQFVKDYSPTTGPEGDNEITYLNITGDFSLSDDVTGVEVFTALYSKVPNKKLIINGNNHTIDFRNIAYQLLGIEWDVVIQNLKIYSGNDWGAFEGFPPVDKITITFFNVEQYGAQAYEGSHGKIVIGGKSSFESSNTETYVSSIDGKLINIYGANSFGSSNIAAREVYIKSGSDIIVKNGRLGGNFILYGNGNFYVEDGTDTKISLLNTEDNVKNRTWVGGDYAPATISIVSDFSLEPYTWPDDLRPSTLKGKKDNIYLGEGTHLSVNNGLDREAHAGALQIENANGAIEIAKNSSIIVDIAKDSGQVGIDDTPIFFENTGSFILDENASFEMSIGSKDDAERSLGPAVEFRGNNGVLSVGKSASFKVNSSSNYTIGLINFTGINGKIDLDEQSTFDIGYSQSNANPLIQAGSAQVTIPPTGNYTHTIRLWATDNFEENSPSIFLQPLDQTAFQVAGNKFSNITTTATPELENQLTTELSNNVQRLVVEPLTYTVTLNEVTNETQSTYTVSGKAAPADGSVQLLGGPFAENAQSPQPIKINPNGSFSWSGTLSRPFNAGEKIQAQYVGGQGMGETTVVDRTNPSVTVKDYHLKEGDLIPNVQDFILTATDSNPTTTDIKNFTVKFTDTVITPQVPAKIMDGSAEQTFIGHLQIADAAGNLSDPVEVKLIVESTTKTVPSGDLRIDHVPTDFIFEPAVVSSADQTVKGASVINDAADEPDAAQSTQHIQIFDSRTDADGWAVKASLSNFTNVNDATDDLTGAVLILPKGELRNTLTVDAVNPTNLISAGDVSLTAEDQTIFSGSGANSKDETTYAWNKNQVKLMIPGGLGKVNQSYQATITWTITANVSN